VETGLFPLVVVELDYIDIYIVEALEQGFDKRLTKLPLPTLMPTVADYPT
jgi:hypothetical protein